MSIDELGFDLDDPRFDRLKNHIYDDKTRYNPIRTFSSISKEEALIYRLAIFAPEYLSTYLNEFSSLDMIQFFGEWRKQACLNFINSLAHFPHTNKSLFRLFGYPTKAISERGRVNAKKLVQESINADKVEVSFLEVFLSKALADYKENLQHIYDEKQNELIQPISLLVNQLLQKKWVLDTEKWDTSSNHSQSDLEAVKNMLENKITNSSIISSPADITVNEKIYSPDLILKNQMLSEEIFVELKVLNYVSSHFYPFIHLNQLFRYSSVSRACILVIYHSPEIEKQKILDKMSILAETKDYKVKDLLLHLRKQYESVNHQLMNASTEKKTINDALTSFYSFISQTNKKQVKTHELEIIDVLLQSYSSIQSSFSIGYLNKVIRTVKRTTSNLEKKPLHSKIRFVNLHKSSLETLIDAKESFLYRIGFLLFPKRNSF
jgi:hypothetical protein